MVAVSCALEGEQVPGILLQFGQPVDEKFIGLPVREAHLAQGLLQKGGGIPAPDTEALRKVPVLRGDALPEQTVVCPAVSIGKSAVRGGGDGPAVFIGGVGAGELSVVAEADGDFCFLLGVEIDHRLGSRCCRAQRIQ